MHDHGREFRRGRRRGRGGDHSLLATRLLEPALLVFLSKNPEHGYTLLEKAEGIGLGAQHPSVVYRVLREMEEAGWVSSVWEDEQSQGPPRRVYSLTGDGLAALRAWKTHLEQSRDVILRLIEQIQPNDTQVSK